MEKLATILRRERWLLSTLVFRLVELHHLLQDGDPRFLGWASNEVDDAVARVREADLMRAALVSGTPAGDASEMYAEIVAEHERVIAELLAEVQSLSEDGARLASEAIAAFGEAADLDEELAQVGYRTALAATQPLRLNKLTDFAL
jgi:hypothetical protein